MVTKEITLKTGRRLAMVVAVVAVASFTAAPGTAYARDWHGHHHGGWGGGAVALGVLGGALAGAGVASAPPYYNPYNPYYAYSAPYSYSYPQYGYPQYGYPQYAYPQYGY